MFVFFVIDFSPGWYVLLAFSLILFAVFSYLRKSFSGVIKFGLIGLAVGIVGEGVGVGLNLWNYSAGNWPVVLWLVYFLFTAAFYQLFCVLDKR